MFKKVEPKPVLRRKKIIRYIVVFLAVILIAATVFYFVMSQKINSILPGNPFNIIAKDDPIKSINGKTNILVFGTSYDDPNPTHTGGYLTDSLIVLSVDKNQKKASSISIPRDLWVDYGMPCNASTHGKVNATYTCALQAFNADQPKAKQYLSDKISTILGIPIQYYIEVNYTSIQSLTDAFGGIDVDVYSNDSRGIYDPNVGLTLPAGVSHLDGKSALKLARARNAAGGYGLPRSNYDREINQQRIIAALLMKASTNGTLNNPEVALNLINTLSGQVSTSVQTSEIRDMLRTAKLLDVNNIQSISLADKTTTGMIGNQSVVLPLAGLDKYNEIQLYVGQRLEQVKSK